MYLALTETQLGTTYVSKRSLPQGKASFKKAIDILKGVGSEGEWCKA